MNAKTRAEIAILDTLRFYNEVVQQVEKKLRKEFSANDAAAMAEHKSLLEKCLEGGPPYRSIPPKPLLNTDVFFKAIDEEVKLFLLLISNI